MSYTIVQTGVSSKGIELHAENGDRILPSPAYAEQLLPHVGETLEKEKDFEIEWFHQDYGFAVPFGTAYKNN
jgi:hypothetical protein